MQIVDGGFESNMNPQFTNNNNMFSSAPINLPSHLSAFVNTDVQNLGALRNNHDSAFLARLPSSTLLDPIHSESADGQNFNCEPADMSANVSSRSKHDAEDLTSQFICDTCGRFFSERTHLQRHRNVHLEPKHVCEMCGRSFVREDKLKRHVRCVHSQERPFVCEVCAKAFARKDKLQEHARHHNREITFTCAFCSEVFVMRSHLNRHLRTMHNFNSSDGQSANNALVIPEHLPNGVTRSMLDEQLKIASSRKSKSTKPRKSRVKSDLANSPQVPASSNSSSSLVINSVFGAHPQSSSNSLLYHQPVDQFQQQQQHQQLHHQQQQQQASIRAAAVAAATSYGTTDFSDQQQQQSRYFNQAQQQQQQQQAYPSQTAFSAAMAARLFSPANYVGWWPQASQNLMFQSSVPNQTTGQSLQYSNNNNNATLDPSLPNTDSAITPSGGEPSTDLQPPATHQHFMNSYTNPTTADSVRPVSAVAAAQMFASFPTLAHAVYYQAASLAASQNGTTVQGAIPQSTSMPNAAHCNPMSYNSYSSNLESS